MVNLNKISEIRVILEQMIKEIESLKGEQSVFPVKWDKLFEKSYLINYKLNSLKTDYDYTVIEELRSRLAEENLIIEEEENVIIEMEENIVVEEEGVDDEITEIKPEEHETIGNSFPEWMKEMPGPKVDNIHKAITLNDRLYFIKDLFMGDNEKFRQTIQELNELTSLDEAVQYIGENFPEWDENSSILHRFYLTLRRRYDV